MVTESDIAQSVEEFLKQPALEEGLSELQGRLPDGAAVYLVGGAIRNLAIGSVHGYRPEILDLDFFIDQVDPETDLSKIFSPCPIEKTDLGGIRWRPAGSPCDFDLCLLKDFVVLAKLNLPPGISNLLSNLDFTMNTLVYDVKEKKLYEKAALRDIRRRLVQFNTRVFYTRLAVCYRSLFLRHKTEFVFSERVFDFLRREVDLETLEAARQLLRSRQGRSLSRSIMKDYDRVCTSSSYEDYLEGA